MHDQLRPRTPRPAPLGDARGARPGRRRKAADILRCDEFSHEACGREFTYWIERFGYLGGGCWRAGENIAWGTGSVGSVRAIFRAWLHSSGHRENILGPFTQLGIGLRVGKLEGNRRRPRLDPGVRQPRAAERGAPGGA